MVLNKRYKRNIKSNLSFYISVIILTAVIVMVYMTMACGLESMEDYLDDFKQESVMEDAQFTTFLALDDQTVQDLEEEYDLTIEQQEYIDVDAHQDTIRLFGSTDEINRYRVMEGSDVSSDDDLLLSTSYLENNDVKIGDTFTLNGKDYNVCGAFGRPDYLYVLQEFRGSFATPETFGLAMVSDNEYENIYDDLSKDQVSYYSVKYGDSDIQAFREELNDKAMVSSYISKDNNNRISTADSTLEMTWAIKNVIVPIIFLFIVIIVAVVLQRKIKSERKMIGILSALGYSKSKLAFHYSAFGAFAALIGSVIGVILSLPMQNVLIPMAFVKLESFPVQYGLTTSSVLVSIILPLVAYTAAVFFTAFAMMRKDTVYMLNGTDDKKHRTRFRMGNSEMKFSGKFKIRSIFGKPARSIIIVVGICIGSLIFLYTLGVVDSLKLYVDDSVNKMGNFEYQYYFNEIKNDEPEEGVPVASSNFECKDSDSAVTLMGMENNDLLNRDLVSGGKADLESGDYYLTNMGATMYGLEEGDQLVLINMASLEETTVKISGIIDNDSQNIVYTSSENACKLMDVQEGSYNLVLSEEKLDYSDSELNQTITKSSYKKQIQTVYELVKSEVGIMLPFGVIICICVIYIMVNMLISENRTSISMLKVLGYRDREINKIVINVYHFVIPVAALLGIGAGYLFIKSYLEANINAFNTYIETHFSVMTIVVYFLLVVVSYVISLLILGRKVKNVDMTESLKVNRE